MLKNKLTRFFAAGVVAASLALLAGCGPVIVGGGGGYHHRHCTRWCHNGWCSRHCYRY